MRARDFVSKMEDPELRKQAQALLIPRWLMSFLKRKLLIRRSIWSKKVT